MILLFEIKSSCSKRLQTDKFALFSEFTDNYCTLYKPGAFVTVDEQLFPSKARCPFASTCHQNQTTLGKNIGWL